MGQMLNAGEWFRSIVSFREFKSRHAFDVHGLEKKGT